jgi:hypothetical protein
MSRVFRLCVFFPVAIYTRFPVIPALVALVAAGLVTSQIATTQIPAPIWWLVHGLLAAGLGLALGLPRWWLPFQVLAPTAFALLLLSGWSPWLSLGVVIVLLLLYGGGVATRVPLYLSNRAAHAALAEVLAARPAPVAVDLGAGFAGPMRALGKRFPAGRFIAVEASPVTCLIAWILALPRRNVRVVWGDLWRTPLAEVDLVYVFLSPAPMPEIWRHFQAQAAPGALLVSNTFPVPGVTAEQEIDLPGRADARLFIYRR